MPPSHYVTMGIARTASSGELRKAYLARARERHPDLAGGSDAAMAELNAAFAVLSDPQERKAYDRSLGPDTGPASRRGAAADSGHSHGPVELNDDGPGLSLPMRFLTRAVPLLFVASFFVLIVGSVIQVQQLFAAGIAMGLASLVLFALMPFFAMSSKGH